MAGRWLVPGRLRLVPTGTRWLSGRQRRGGTSPMCRGTSPARLREPLNLYGGHSCFRIEQRRAGATPVPPPPELRKRHRASSGRSHARCVTLGMPGRGALLRQITPPGRLAAVDVEGRRLPAPPRAGSLIKEGCAPRLETKRRARIRRAIGNFDTYR